ncbi:MAG: hypothetical protein RIS70_994 [Planctomycetota bacterium]
MMVTLFYGLRTFAVISLPVTRVERKLLMWLPISICGITR